MLPSSPMLKSWSPTFLGVLGLDGKGTGAAIHGLHRHRRVGQQAHGQAPVGQRPEQHERRTAHRHRDGAADEEVNDVHVHLHD
jgi:hypothetical protein